MSKYCLAVVSLHTWGEDNDEKAIDTILKEKLAVSADVIDSRFAKHKFINNDILFTNRDTFVIFTTSWDLYEDLEKRLIELSEDKALEVVGIAIERSHEAYLKWVDERLRKDD